MRYVVEARLLHRAFLLTIAGFVASGVVARTARADDPPTKSAAGKNSLVPAAPVLPAEVVSAMQEGRYDEAGKQLAILVQKSTSSDDQAYFSYIHGIAQRLGNHRDSARDTLKKSLQTSPKSRWVTKIRYELAGIELASGNWAPAEELARAEAERLLSGDRKDRLAGIYQEYARRLLETGDPLVAPDPNAAYELLVQARELAESPPVARSLLFAMGRASMAASDPARAIENFQLYVREYPTGADRLTRAASSSATPSRKPTSLCSPGEPGPISPARSSASRRPSLPRKSPRFAPTRSMQSPRLTEFPIPPDDTSLNQGVAALRRFLSAYPGSPRRPFAPPISSPRRISLAARALKLSKPSPSS